MVEYTGYRSQVRERGAKGRKDRDILCSGGEGNFTNQGRARKQCERARRREEDTCIGGMTKKAFERNKTTAKEQEAYGEVTYVEECSRATPDCQ